MAVHWGGRAWKFYLLFRPAVSVVGGDRTPTYLLSPCHRQSGVVPARRCQPFPHSLVHVRALYIFVLARRSLRVIDPMIYRQRAAVVLSHLLQPAWCRCVHLPDGTLNAGTDLDVHGTDERRCWLNNVHLCTWNFVH